MDITIIQLLKDILLTHEIEVQLFKDPYDNIPNFDEGFRRWLYNDYNYNEIIEYIEAECRDDTILDITDQFDVHYYIFRNPPYSDTNNKSEYVSIGPYILKDQDKYISTVIQRNDMPLITTTRLREFYYRLPVIMDKDVLEEMILVFAKHIFSGSESFKFKKDSIDFKPLNNGHEYNIDIDEKVSMQIIEERYHEEDELLDAIRRGDLNSARHYDFKKYRIEPRVSDRLRNGKNMVIIMNTLCRKAVQSAEVHPAHIDKASEIFAKRIELALRERDLTKIKNDMIRKYCLLVKNQSLRGYSKNVQNVINYIDFNLTEPLSLKLLAEKFHINSSYLSTQFKKETGITVTDFINQRRIRRSLIYLASTDVSIQSIAEKVGIYDENYFSRIFKKIQKKTPTEYRKISYSQIEEHTE